MWRRGEDAIYAQRYAASREDSRVVYQSDAASAEFRKRALAAPNRRAKDL
jgi:hypothetical protein